MRIEPDLWIKLRPLPAPAHLDERVFVALRDQVRRLDRAGLVVVSGNETDWCTTPPQPRNWLELPYKSIAHVKFAVVGVLVRRYSLRAVVRDSARVCPLPERVALLKEAVAHWLQAGIAIGGGREGVEVLFPTLESFEAWAAEGEIPRRHIPAPFSPYPRPPIDAG